MKNTLILTDRERRVLANLSLPRSLPTLAREVARDPWSTFERTLSMDELANEVATTLGELAEAGLAVNIGVESYVDKLIAKLEDDERVPTLHPEKAEQFADRMKGKDGYKLREGELWYFTEKGREALISI